MRLKFDWFDGRRRCIRDVIDEDTGKTVGFIYPCGVGFENTGGIEISLFGGKYRTMVNSYNECLGFVLGVQCVLRHMTETTNHAAQESVAA